jgi:tetratricopeptide (TPR) repeat protein
MRTVLLLLCVVSLWCGEGSTATWDALPQSARVLVDGILERNRILEPELDLARTREAFAALVETCRPPAGTTDPEAVIAHLNSAILGSRKVSYLSNQYWRDSSFAAALVRKQGNCLATTTLYVAVGRALGFPIQAVFIPEHAFASWRDDTTRINIETTAGGRVTPDLDYMRRFAWDMEYNRYYGWMGKTTDEALLAQLDLVAAHHLAGQLQYAQAQIPLDRARKVWPWRNDLELLALTWEANRTGDRAPLFAAAQRMATLPHAPGVVVLPALRILAAEYRGRLDRAHERESLLQAYGLAPWNEQGDILHQMSTCLRGLRDRTGAVFCMELVVAKDPANDYKRAWLAGMLSEAGRVDEGLTMIKAVRAHNPEEVWFASIEAGLLVLAGRRDEGRKVYDGITAPRTGLEYYEVNRAWFLAVWGDRAEFYPQFEKALSQAKDPSVLSWIAEDDDLDPYRKDERFIAAVETCRGRLLKTVSTP